MFEIVDGRTTAGKTHKHWLRWAKNVRPHIGSTHSGSVVECFTGDQGPWVRASPASLSCGPWARHIYPSLVLVQPRKTHPCLAERLLMGRKESNQTNKNKKQHAGSTSIRDDIVMLKWRQQVACQRNHDLMTAFFTFFQYKMKNLVWAKQKNPLFV